MVNYKHNDDYMKPDILKKVESKLWKSGKEVNEQDTHFLGVNSA